MRKLITALALLCAGLAAAAALADSPSSGSTTDSTSTDTTMSATTDTTTTSTDTTTTATTTTTTTTPPPPTGQPSIAYGVADDSAKWADDGGATFDGLLLGAGLTENRWTLPWDASRPTEITQLPFLEHAAPIAQAEGIHVVLALYSTKARNHPAAAFCKWAGTVATTVKQWGITDFIVWNEPNTRLYWFPQKNAKGKEVAAQSYEHLLATCYDSIKRANPQARVIGMGLSPRASTFQSTEPLTFLRDVGAAYRASHRKRPLMDQLAIHPYPNPNSPADPPSVGYPQPARYGIPNLARVKQAVWDAFHGTAQKTTLNGLTFRIDEVGWQVDTTGLSGYVNAENVKTVTPSQQSAYLAQMVQRYFACDPTVTDVLLFLLIDEQFRNGRDTTGKVVGGGWQSGLVTVAGATRPAYDAMGRLAAEGRSACALRTVQWQPTVSTKQVKKGTVPRRK